MNDDGAPAPAGGHLTDPVTAISRLQAALSDRGITSTWAKVAAERTAMHSSQSAAEIEQIELAGYRLPANRASGQRPVPGGVIFPKGQSRPGLFNNLKDR
jgi:hypothetical protein